MMDIQVFHAYNRLVAQGVTKPLTCPDCDQIYVIRITEDNEPLLACVWCNTVVQPGIRLYSDVHSVVKEHNVGTIK